jgi:ABC-type uncharacterized transport system permease subunit
MFIALTIAALLGYVVATTMFLVEIAVRGRPIGRWSVRVTWVAFALHAVAVASAVVSADGDVSSLFRMPKSLMSVALLLTLGYLLVERVYDLGQIGSLVSPLAVVLLTVVLLSAPDVSVSEPMRGVLAPVHIVLAMIGTVAFALAFVVGLLYIAQDRQLKRKQFGVLFRSLPPLHQLDNVSLRCVTVGFPIYTVAILLGMVRAVQVSSGKHIATASVFAMLTWVLYGLVLHARLTAGWRGRKAALMTVLGFLSAAGVVVAYLVH